MQITFWNYLVIFNSEILVLKLSLRMNSKFYNDQRRHYNRLATVIFHGTPCMLNVVVVLFEL